MTFKMALLMFDARWTPLTARLQLVAAKFWAGMAAEANRVQRIGKQACWVTNKEPSQRQQ